MKKESGKGIRAEENRRAAEIAERTMRKIKEKEARERKVGVVIFGTRTFRDYKLFEKEVTKFLDRVMKEEGLPQERIYIVEGEASGADKMAVRYALEYGYEYKPFPADWKTYGRRAGMIRNEDMSVEARWGIGFWDGQSVGTKGMINICKKYGNRLRVVEYNN